MKNLFILLLLISTLTVASEQNISSTKWEKAPNLNLSTSVLDKKIKVFYVDIEFITDNNGNVKAANVSKSSGNHVIDKMAKNSILKAKMQPYYENGKTIPIYSIQSFQIENPDAKERSFYQCWWELESAQYQKQQSYQLLEDALNNLDFIYLEQPSISNKFESNKFLNEEIGHYDVVIYSKNGHIDQVTSPTSKDIHQLFAIQALEGKNIQPKRPEWAKYSREYTDTITLFKKCNPTLLK